MITKPQADAKIDDSRFASLPKAKPGQQPPMADATKPDEPSILKRLQELVAKDTGWEPCNSGAPSSRGEIRFSIVYMPPSNRKHNSHGQIPD